MNKTITINQDTTKQEISNIISDAIYTCYKYNRERNPQTPTERYRVIFANVDAMEQRYQKELADAKNKLN